MSHATSRQGPHTVASVTTAQKIIIIVVTLAMFHRLRNCRFIIIIIIILSDHLHIIGKKPFSYRNMNSVYRPK